MLFTATATTDTYPDGFIAGAATKADFGNNGTIALALNVVSGPPAAPNGFRATGGGNSQTTLVWTDPDNAGITVYEYRQTTDAKATLIWDADTDATGWQYRHSRDGGTNWAPDWTAISGSDASTVAHTVAGVDPEDDNSFEVRPLKTVPDQPAVTLIGEPISAGVFSGSWNSITGSGPTTTSYILTGLNNAETYFFQLRAVTSGGAGEAAISNGAETIFAALAKPNGFTATPSDNVTEVILAWAVDATATGGWEYRQTTASAALLAWTQTEDNTITGWEYRHSQDGGTNWNPDWTAITPTVDSTDATIYTAIVAGIDPDNNNLFQVRPTRDGGDQTAVTLDSQTIIGDFTAAGDWMPAAGDGLTVDAGLANNYRVSGLDFVNNTNYFEVRPVKETNDGETVELSIRQLGSITLRWNNPSDNTITKYQYHLVAHLNTIADWVDIINSAHGEGNATSFTIPNLNALVLVPSGDFVTLTDSVYTVMVRAVNESGDMDGAEVPGHRFGRSTGQPRPAPGCAHQRISVLQPG